MLEERDREAALQKAADQKQRQITAQQREAVEKQLASHSQMVKRSQIEPAALVVLEELGEVPPPPPVPCPLVTPSPLTDPRKVRQGAFGTVSRGVYAGTPCAIKTLKARKGESADKTAAAEFARDGLLRLGPTFVKLGQARARISRKYFEKIFREKRSSFRDLEISQPRKHNPRTAREREAAREWTAEYTRAPRLARRGVPRRAARGASRSASH